MASSTPGYCTLTATARPSWVMARCTWPIDAGGDRHRVPLGEQLVGRRAQLGLDHPGRQLGRHRRRVLLQLGERVAHGLGQALVEVAGHLAELHQRALHVPERLGHLLGRAQLVRGVELGVARSGDASARRSAVRPRTRRRPSCPASPPRRCAPPSTVIAPVTGLTTRAPRLTARYVAAAAPKAPTTDRDPDRLRTGTIRTVASTFRR